MRTIEKPKAGEYPEYANMYISLLPEDGLLLQHLKANLESTKKLMKSLPEQKLLHSYAVGKWTIKEVLLHIIDDERIYAYRALRYARADQTPLPGFEQDDFARYSDANSRSIDSMLEEFESVRNATITLFKYLPEESLLRRGTSDGKQATVRAMAYHIAGHEVHHVNIIREKYLSQP